MKELNIKTLSCDKGTDKLEGLITIGDIATFLHWMCMTAGFSPRQGRSTGILHRPLMEPSLQEIHTAMC